MKRLKTANVRRLYKEISTSHRPPFAIGIALCRRAAEVTIRWPLTLALWHSCLEVGDLTSNYTILFVVISSRVLTSERCNLSRALSCVGLGFSWAAGWHMTRYKGGRQSGRASFNSSLPGRWDSLGCLGLPSHS